jgi:hypothetical protein
MKLIRVQDKYNLDKVWIIKRTKCGHYFLQQEIKGILFYSRFTRVTKKWLSLDFDMNVFKNK